MDRDNILIAHILDEIAFIGEIIEGVPLETFVDDRTKKHSVERAFEIIGESSKGISNTTRDKYPHIPWKDIAGLRDKISHHYFDVDYRNLWSTAKYDLPILEQTLKNHIAI